MERWESVKTEMRASLMRWVIGRCPHRVVVNQAAADRFLNNRPDIHMEDHVHDAVEWCRANVGPSCFRYTERETICRPNRALVNRSGVWAYGVRSLDTYYFADADAAFSFKLRWA